MTLAGRAAFPSSNRRSSIPAACFENTLKLTPSPRTMAPSGALAPRSAERAFIP
jgi:hypothetical protein